MHVELPHTFTKAEAKERVNKALKEVAPQMAQHAQVTKQEWEGDILRFEVVLQGKTIDGTLAIEEDKFVLDATLPLLWRMFEGKIERAIEEQVKQAL